MAKLHFIHSVMNAGKSTALLQVRYNYIDNGGRVMLFTSAVDDRAGLGRISSRLGHDAEAYALTSSDNVFAIVDNEHSRSRPVTAVLVDEVQFLSSDHIRQLSDIVDYLDIPVMAYGLKNNAYGELFSDAIKTLLALANESNELKQVCHCGSKATMILKYNPDGSVVRRGEVVETGAESRYVSVCRKHWKMGDIGQRNRAALMKAGTAQKVICHSCGTGHDIGFDDLEQGNGCAAKLFGRVIEGYYGSTVADGDRFFLKGRRPEKFVDGLICDECIKELKSAGLIERDQWQEIEEVMRVSQDELWKVEE